MCVFVYKQYAPEQSIFADFLRIIDVNITTSISSRHSNLDLPRAYAFLLIVVLVLCDVYIHTVWLSSVAALVIRSTTGTVRVHCDMWTLHPAITTRS